MALKDIDAAGLGSRAQARQHGVHHMTPVRAFEESLRRLRDGFQHHITLLQRLRSHLDPRFKRQL
ncbi:hypothetical protein HC928_26240 [bacterium]|nr:hypothetical protein [bacterium]